ncbi:MAG: tRNA pseudouridine(55) synthase TruB [Vicinamibacterales bacterium]
MLSTDTNGLLIVNKPVGPTSHDVVACARRALDTRKIGHTGTLDPAASGVLGLVVGRATRLAQFLSGSEKEYIATIRFGRTTDTYDSAGEVTSETGAVPDRESLERALTQFVGAFEQTPPGYSAKKLDGVRAYALARRKVAVVPRPVTVIVHRIEIVRQGEATADICLTCSAGFYVRSLAHDLGRQLGTGAMLDGLVRVRLGRFSLAESVGLDVVMGESRAQVEQRLLPLEALLTDFRAVVLTEDGVRRARQGQNLAPHDIAAPDAGGTSSDGDARGLARLMSHDGRLVGVAEWSGPGGSLHPTVIVG